MMVGIIVKQLKCLQNIVKLSSKDIKIKLNIWILVNQINLIEFESFNHLGIPSDHVDNLMEAKYQEFIMS